MSFVSRFERLPRWKALCAFALLIAAILGGTVLSRRALAGGTNVVSAVGSSDLALYRAIVADVRGGESYYSAAANQLRARGYALRPALNFRPPTLAWTLARFPSDASAQWLLVAVTWFAFSVWTVRFLQMGVPPPALMVILAVTSTGSLLGLSTAALHWHELWSGLFVMIALGVYGPRAWPWSIAAALTACLFRELALPLPFVMAAFAMWQGRPREAGVWMATVVACALLLWAHLAHAADYVRATDLGNSWSALGGWTFVLSTARWNYALISAPVWVLAVVVPASLFGLVGWRHPVAARAAGLLAAWLTAFSFVGRPDNHYWGLMYSPLIAIGCALAPFSLLALARSLVGIRPSRL